MADTNISRLTERPRGDSLGRMRQIRSEVSHGVQGYPSASAWGSFCAGQSQGWKLKSNMLLLMRQLPEQSSWGILESQLVLPGHNEDRTIGYILFNRIEAEFIAYNISQPNKKLGLWEIFQHRCSTQATDKMERGNHCILFCPLHFPSFQKKSSLLL